MGMPVGMTAPIPTEALEDLGEQLGAVVELMQHDLEPELVHLMDHDEEHFVVLNVVSRLLECQ